MDPQLRARGYVLDYIERTERWVSLDPSFKLEDVLIVWYCYILGGWKALITTTRGDGKYYEVTYNKEKEETYVDVYVKVDNFSVRN